MLEHIPTWARGAVDAFRSYGTLPGDSRRTDLTPDQARNEQTGACDLFQEIAEVDEGPLDEARDQRGVVTIDLFGLRADFYYGGDIRRGELVEVVGDQAAAYITFTAESVDSVLVGKAEDGSLKARGVHVDRNDPHASFEVVVGEGWMVSCQQHQGIAA